MDLVTLRNAVKAQGGFGSVPDATVNEWINERYKQAVMRSQWRMAEVSIGTTVAGTSNYPISSDRTVADIRSVRVGTVKYEAIGQSDMWRLRYDQGVGLSRGIRGVFAPDWDSAGVAQVELYPTPVTSGDTIYGLESIEPAVLVGDTDTPVIPDDFHESLIDGALAVGMARWREEWQQADRYEQRFEKAVQDLGRRKNSRVGSGPIRIEVVR